MTQASALRSFAITAEFVAGLVPRLAQSRALSKAEAALLVKQLKTGAEVALDIVAGMEKRSSAILVDRDDLIEQCARAAEMQDRAGYEWVKDSLWDTLCKRTGAAVRRLKEPTAVTSGNRGLHP